MSINKSKIYWENNWSCARLFLLDKRKTNKGKKTQETNQQTNKQILTNKQTKTSAQVGMAGKNNIHKNPSHNVTFYRNSAKNKRIRLKIYWIPLSFFFYSFCLSFFLSFSPVSLTHTHTLVYIYIYIYKTKSLGTQSTWSPNHISVGVFGSTLP